MNTIGSRLKKERTRLGLTQATMALLAGCTKRTQIYYEANERSPDSNYLSSIAEAGVDINYVLTGESKTSDPQAQKMVSLFMKMDAAARNRAVNALEDIYDLSTLRNSRKNEPRQSA